MKSAIIIDFAAYQNKQITSTPTDCQGESHDPDDLGTAIQLLIQQLRQSKHSKSQVG